MQSTIDPDIQALEQLLNESLEICIPNDVEVLFERTSAGIEVTTAFRESQEEEYAYQNLLDMTLEEVDNALTEAAEDLGLRLVEVSRCGSWLRTHRTGVWGSASSTWTKAA